MGNLVGLADGYIGDIKRIMPPRFNLIGQEQKRRVDDASDWRRIAPRWFLLLLLIIGAGVMGSLVTKIETAAERDQARLQAAILDAPTKYQARLSERVAVVEAQTQALSASMAILAAKMDAHTKATDELTYQLKLLTAEMKARR